MRICPLIKGRNWGGVLSSPQFKKRLDDKRMGFRAAGQLLLAIIGGKISKGMWREICWVARDGMCGRVVPFTHKEIRKVIG